jgi:hypothetical protein
MTKKRAPALPFLFLSVSGVAFALGWFLKPDGLDARHEVAERGNCTHAPPRSLTGAMVPSERMAESTDAAPADGQKPRSTIGAFASYIRNGNIPARNIGAAIDSTINENDAIKRLAIFSQLLEEITPENAVAAYDALQKHRGGEQDGSMRIFLNAWGRVDGHGAVTELLAREQERREAAGAGRNEGHGIDPLDVIDAEVAAQFDLYNVVTGWAITGAGAASEWLDTHKVSGKDGFSSAIVRGLLVSGVDEALAFVSSLPAEDGRRSGHLAGIAGEMLEQGAESAAAWAAGISEPDLKGGAMGRIAGEYAGENLDAAVAWVAPHAGRDYAIPAITRIAQQWAESDPDATIDWASSLPENARAEVFKKVLEEWTELDPLAASLRLRKCPVRLRRTRRSDDSPRCYQEKIRNLPSRGRKPLATRKLAIIHLLASHATGIVGIKNPHPPGLPRSGLSDETVKSIQEQQGVEGGHSRSITFKS